MLLFKRVRELCAQNNVSLGQVIKGADLSESAYRWKDNTKEPSLESIVKICGYLHISLIDFFNGVEDVDLTEEQQRLLERWRELGSLEKKTLIEILEAFEKIKG